MADRPILMSAPMVRALLAGTKTQTRRVVKFHGLLDFERGADGVWHFRTAGGVTAVRCPYGVPGDRLWVKETWQAQDAFDNLSPSAIGTTFEEELGGPDACPIRYVADGKCEGSVDLWQQSLSGKTRVSIHMPRWASRLTLKITDVRVERLNDISEADALAEGLQWVSPTYGIDGIAETWRADPVASYRALWDHINGPGSWAANPWVWAVSFEVVQ